MVKPAIICVEDQREVLAALVKDLDALASHFDVVDCDSAADARTALDDLDADGVPIALIISDHVMPHETGVQFLAAIHHDGRFDHVRKLLLTGQATHDDTINAINRAHVNAYLKKPWRKANLLETVRIQLTHFIFDTGLNYLDFPGQLDADVILERMQ